VIVFGTRGYTQPQGEPGLWNFRLRKRDLKFAYCRYQTHSDISPPTFSHPPPPTFLQWSVYGDQTEDLWALPKMQIEHTCGRDWQLSTLLPESPWSMHSRRFSEPLAVASQLHSVPVSGRSTVHFPATHFIAQARSRFPSVIIGVAIQAQILNMNARTANVQVWNDAEFWLLNYVNRTGSKPSKTTEYAQARSRSTFPNWCHDSSPNRHSSLTWCWTLTPKLCSKFTQGRHTADGCTVFI